MARVDIALHVAPRFARAACALAVAFGMPAAAVAQEAPPGAALPSGHPKTEGVAVDPVDKAIVQFRRLQGYRATIRAMHAGTGAASDEDRSEVIRYAWRRPGFVRMEFERPHKGAQLVYAPDSRRVRLWPFGIGLLPPMNLAPDNPLISSPTGQRVDRSDVGALLENIRDLRKSGGVVTAGTDTLDGHPATHVIVSGGQDAAVGKVHRYDVWFDDATAFPLKVVSRDAAGREIETVRMQDVVIDPEFPPGFFTP
jgi:outer membrane lipoprotein-sorting protein